MDQWVQPNSVLSSLSQSWPWSLPRCCFGTTSQSTCGLVQKNRTLGLQAACSGKGQMPFPWPPSKALVCLVVDVIGPSVSS